MNLSDFVSRLFPKRNAKKNRPQKKKRGAERTVRLALESLEDRTLPSVLPAPLVSNQGVFAAQEASDPKIAYDPNNPNNVVAVFNVVAEGNGANGTPIAGAIAYAYSTNGGATWTMPTTQQRVVPGGTIFTTSQFAIDQQVNPNVAQPTDSFGVGVGSTNGIVTDYSEASNASIAWDRHDHFYVVGTLHDATNNSGELLISKFSFASGAPTAVFQDTNLQQWAELTNAAHDPVYNPVVAVDDNIQNVTDANTGKNTPAGSQDTLSDNVVWVLWDTNVNGGAAIATGGTTGNPVTNNGFGPYSIKALVSWNGGAPAVDPTAVVGLNPAGPQNYSTWTTPVYFDNYSPTDIINSVGYNATGPATLAVGQPVVLFTQPSIDGSVKGGEMITAWTDSIGDIVVSRQQPNAGNSANAVVDSYGFLVTGASSEVSTTAEFALPPPTPTPTPTPPPTFTGSIPDSIANYNTSNARVFPDTPDSAAFNYTVTSSDVGLGDILDANVTVDLAATHLSDISIDLYSPSAPYVPPTAVNPNPMEPAHIRLLVNQVGTNGNGQVTNKNVFNQNAGLADNGTGDGQGGLGITEFITNPLASFTVNGVTYREYQRFDVGTTFDQQAPVKITDGSVVSPYVGFYRPELNGDSEFNLGGLVGLNGSSAVGLWTLVVTDNYNETATGNFHQGSDNLDYINNATLDKWGITFTTNTPALGNYNNFTNYFGTDAVVAQQTKNPINNLLADGSPVRGGATNTYAFTSPVTANTSAPNGSNFGIGPSISLAQDKSVGSYSPDQGRVYLAYTGTGTNPLNTTAAQTEATNSNIFLIASDTAGNTWGAPSTGTVVAQTAGNIGAVATQVNDDNALDAVNSEGNRSQLDPSVAVDPVTGTVVVSWYDARWDASNARISTFIAASIDGGSTFSVNEYLNENKTATNEITNSTVNLEPIPDNMSLAGSGPDGDGIVGFGEDQGLAVYGGHILDIWTGNLNANGVELLTATVDMAAGPRVVSGDEGDVTSDFTATAGTNLSTAYGLAGGFNYSSGVATYNNVFAADGTRELTGFVVTFDRPVDVASFTPSQVQVFYRSPVEAVSVSDPDGVAVGVGNVTALDPGNSGVGFGVRHVGAGTGVGSTGGTALLATSFFIALMNPQSNVGTYSYAIGDATGGLGTIFDFVSDGSIAGPNGTFTGPAQNYMDQNNNSKTDEGDLASSTGDGDRFAVPGPTGSKPVPFNLPYDPNTLPLIVPGPHVISTSVPFSSLSAPGSADTVYNTQPVAIPTSSTVTSSLTFTDNFQIEHATLNLNINFPTDANLTISLIATINSVARTIVLFNGATSGQNLSGFSGTTFDGLANHHIMPTADETLPSSYTGYFLPLASLDAVLDGQLSAGTYTLRITNSSASNSGTLVNWSLTLAKTDNEVLNNTASAIDVVFDRDMYNNAANASDPNNFTAANIVRIVGPNGLITGPFTVKADPAGTPAFLAARTFEIDFPTQQLDGTYTVVFGPRPNNVTNPSGFPVSANPEYPSTPGGTDDTRAAMDTNLNAGLAVLRGTDPTDAGTTVNTYKSANTLSNTTVPIPAGNGMTATATINVPDDFVVQFVTIQLSMTFPQDNQLTITLVAPDNSSVQLYDFFLTTPPSNANFNGTIFSDLGTTPIQNGTGDYQGSYTPQFPLAGFIGRASAGTWKLIVTNHNTNLGSIGSVVLSLSELLPGTGLGEVVADQATASFRIFTQDPTNPLSASTWTAVGPIAQDGTGNAAAQTAGNPSNYSRVNVIAVDPSDSSGNTVYVGTGVGGLWKTTNFLTTDPRGPTYIPLTDFGPNQAMNISAIAVVPNTGIPDPTKSILVVGTGDPNTVAVAGANATPITPGVGFLYSPDGGLTWVLEDSLTNYDNAGNLLPIASPLRDHRFVGDVVNKIIVDPSLSSITGKNVLYAAISGPSNPGIYQSIDGGKDWTLLRAGNATDVAFAQNSNSTGGLEKIFFAAFANDGVYEAVNVSEGNANFVALLNSGSTGDDPAFVDDGVMPPAGEPLRNTPVPVNAPGLGNTTPPNLPTGASRIILATPSLVQGINPLANFLYEGWLYALTPTSLYVTKDYGATWTEVNLSSINLFPTNDETSNAYGNPAALSGYDLTLAVDPNDPNIVYLGGVTSTSLYIVGSSFIGVRPNGDGLIRVDLTKISDAHAFDAYDNSNNDGGLAQLLTTGDATVVNPDGRGRVYHFHAADQPTPTGSTPYLDVFADPNNLFAALNQSSTSASLFSHNVTSFTNTGDGVTWLPFNEASSSPGAVPGLPNEYAYHDIVIIRDPLTGQDRLYIAGDEGVWTGIDKGGATLSTDIGNTQLVHGSRNGNLQIAELTLGAASPSTLSTDISQALFMASTGPMLVDAHAPNLGFPQSDPQTLSNGNQIWYGLYTVNAGTSPRQHSVGGGVGVAFDPSGNGITYYYEFPGLLGFIPNPPAFSPPLQQRPVFGTSSDFFQINNPTLNVNAVSRVNGLNSTDHTLWPGNAIGNTFTVNGVGSTFAVNAESPVRDTSHGGIVMSSQWSAADPNSAIYETVNNGQTWFPISSNLNGDGTYAPALAFGAAGSAVGGPDNFIYVGTTGGHIYITLDGGHTWSLPSIGLDGSPVQQITADPTGGKYDAYAVTSRGVYYLANGNYLATGAAPVWVNITGNLFGLSVNEFGNALLPQQFMATGGLTSLVADWRIANLNVPGNPGAGTHPILYVGGVGGVVRSDNQGKTWTIFPNIAANGSAQDDGMFPNVRVTSLTLAVGAINPNSGQPDQTGGYDTLLATTEGRGAFAIRLDNNLITGPTIVSVLPAPAGTTVSAVDVTFSRAIDPATFTAVDITKFTDPNGNAITPISISEDTAAETATTKHTIFRVTFLAQSTPGVYNISIGPKISDPTGDQMNQNGNGVNGEPTDAFTGHFFLNTTATGPTVPALFAVNPANGEVVVDVSNGQSGQGAPNMGKFQGLAFYDLFPPTVTWINVHSGDFNGDGLADMVGEIAQNGQVWVSLTNPANTGFTTAQWTNLDLSQNWQDFVVGDFNGDGRTDIAVYNATTGQVFVGTSNNAGFNMSVWTKPGDWSTTINWSNVVVGDFNGDGKADLAAFDPATGKWWVSLSTGKTFLPQALWATLPTTSNGKALTYVDARVGDFNGDGKKDIEVRALQTGAVYVGLSNGVNAFAMSVWTGFDPTQTWTDVSVADFTADGKSDILARNVGQQAFYVGVSNGSSFAWSLWSYFGPSYQLTGTQVGLFTGSQHADFAVIDANTGNVFLGVPTMVNKSPVVNAFQPFVAENLGSGHTWADAQAADYDGNFTTDYIIRNQGTGQWMLGLSTGGQVTFSSTLWEQWDPPTPTWTNIVYGDFNGDGKTDVAARILETGKWFVSLNNGQQGYTTAVWTTWGRNSNIVNVVVGDFNGDGKDDIMGLWAPTSGPGQPPVAYVALVNLSLGSAFQYENWATWTWLDGNGNPLPPGSYSWSNVFAADFSGDGNADVVGELSQGVSPSTPQGTSHYWIMWLSNGVNGFSKNFGGFIDVVPGDTLVNVQIGNFTGATGPHPALQIAGFYKGSAGQDPWEVWTMNPSFGPSEPYFFGGGTTPHQPGQPVTWVNWSASVQWANITSGDFNGDGATDLFGLDPATGTLYVSLSTGAGHSFVAPTAWATNNAPGVVYSNVQVGDLNGARNGTHNIDDVLLYTGGLWSAFLSNEPATPSFTGEFWDLNAMGQPEWSPAIAWQYIYLARSM